MSYYKDWDFTPSWVYGKNSGILYDTQKKAKNTSIIPTFDLPSSKQKDSYKTIFKKTQKNYPKIKCINYFIYGKWKESLLKKLYIIENCNVISLTQIKKETRKTS